MALPDTVYSLIAQYERDTECLHTSNLEGGALGETLTSEQAKDLAEEPGVDRALSGDEIVNALGGHGSVRIIRYPDLAHIASWDELTDNGHQAAVILFLTDGPKSGHWICAFKGGPDGTPHFFDPLGIALDRERMRLPKEQNAELGQTEPLLTRLIRTSKTPVSTSRVDFQEDAPGVNTCGRWCIKRILESDMTNAEFSAMVKQKVKESGLLSDAWIATQVGPGARHTSGSGIYGGALSFSVQQLLGGDLDSESGHDSDYADGSDSDARDDVPYGHDKFMADLYGGSSCKTFYADLYGGSFNKEDVLPSLVQAPEWMQGDLVGAGKFREKTKSGIQRLFDPGGAQMIADESSDDDGPKLGRDEIMVPSKSDMLAAFRRNIQATSGHVTKKQAAGKDASDLAARVEQNKEEMAAIERMDNREYAEWFLQKKLGDTYDTKRSEVDTYIADYLRRVEDDESEEEPRFSSVGAIPFAVTDAAARARELVQKHPQLPATTLSELPKYRRVDVPTSPRHDADSRSSSGSSSSSDSSSSSEVRVNMATFRAFKKPVASAAVPAPASDEQALKQHRKELVQKAALAVMTRAATETEFDFLKDVDINEFKDKHGNVIPEMRTAAGVIAALHAEPEKAFRRAAFKQNTKRLPNDRDYVRRSDAIERQRLALDTVRRHKGSDLTPKEQLDAVTKVGLATADPRGKPKEGMNIIESAYNQTRDALAKEQAALPKEERSAPTYNLGRNKKYAVFRAVDDKERWKAMLPTRKQPPFRKPAPAPVVPPPAEAPAKVDDDSDSESNSVPAPTSAPVARPAPVKIKLPLAMKPKSVSDDEDEDDDDIDPFDIDPDSLAGHKRRRDE
jgi:hypothetical protein